MKYLVTSEEMKKYDTYTINEIGIPGDVLMERAALFSAGLILDYCNRQKKEPESFKVLIVCGQGNNGGDGLAVARLLLDNKCNVSVCFVGNFDKASPEVTRQLHILEKYNVIPSHVFPQSEYDVIVDALFGIGLNREITGEYGNVIDRMNQAAGWKLALDIPSGVDATKGNIWGKAFRADVTATFAYGKRGLFFYPGAEYAGEIKVGEIGITERSFDEGKPEMYIYDENPAVILPKRNPAGNKGTFGKVLAITGSKGMAGAAVLCAKAAFRAGAGMVKVITTYDNREILQKSVPEAMFMGYDTEEPKERCRIQTTWEDELKKSMEWADCIVAGPGLGKSDKSKELFKQLLLGDIAGLSKKTIVFDADALNLIAENDELKQLVRENVKEKKQTIVMTPHIAELARLLNKSVSEVKMDFVKAARTAAANYNCIMVCKDARTLVCEKEGPIFLNNSGNSGMATAGSGDVLAGIIAAFYAAGNNGIKQATYGVYLHGKAGDYAAVQKGEAALMASDIIEALPIVQKGNWK